MFLRKSPRTSKPVKLALSTRFKTDTMKEYILSATGETTVTAENPEDAKDQIWDHQHDLEFNQVEAEPLTADSDYFKLHIRTVGSNKRSMGYGMMKSQSALELAFRGASSMCRSLIGRDMAPQMRYELALHLLATLEGDSLKGEKLEENVQKISEKAHELADSDDFEGNFFAEVASENFVIESEDKGNKTGDNQ